MAEFWELFAQVIRTGWNSDEPRMSLAEAERLRPLHMPRSHRAVARVSLSSLPLPKFRIRPGSRLRTAPYVLRRFR